MDTITVDHNTIIEVTIKVGHTTTHIVAQDIKIEVPMPVMVIDIATHDNIRQEHANIVNLQESINKR